MSRNTNVREEKDYEKTIFAEAEDCLMYHCSRDLETADQRIDFFEEFSFLTK
jgi:hypothetical protein